MAPKNKKYVTDGTLEKFLSSTEVESFLKENPTWFPGRPQNIKKRGVPTGKTRPALQFPTQVLK